MLNGNTVFCMSKGGYIQQWQSLLEPFFCLQIHRTFLLDQSIAWSLILIFSSLQKNPNKQQQKKTHPKKHQTKPSRVQQHHRKDGQASQIRKHLKSDRRLHSYHSKNLQFLFWWWPVSHYSESYCRISVKKKKQPFLLSYKAQHLRVSWIMHLLAGSANALLSQSATWSLVEGALRPGTALISWSTTSSDEAN